VAETLPAVARVGRVADGAGEPPAANRERRRVDLEDLRDAIEAKRRADEDARTIVRTLRANGVSWAAIGRVCGISSQGAYYRWR
jgi:DNA invertase Pin-like site-specific DNA recombinase